MFWQIITSQNWWAKHCRIYKFLSLFKRFEGPVHNWEHHVGYFQPYIFVLIHSYKSLQSYFVCNTKKLESLYDLVLCLNSWCLHFLPGNIEALKKFAVDEGIWHPQKYHMLFFVTSNEFRAKNCDWLCSSLLFVSVKVKVKIKWEHLVPIVRISVVGELIETLTLAVKLPLLGLKS